MKWIIKYAKLGGLFLGVLFLSSFIFGILNLIGISYNVTTVLSIIVMIILFLVFGIIEGVNASNKGFVAGLKIGFIFLVIMTIINLILFQSSFNLSRIIYYILLLISSMLGAMIGINRKKKE